MELRLTIAEAAAGTVHDVVIDAQYGTTFGLVRPLLLGLFGRTQGRLTCGDRLLASEDTVGEPPLVQGAVVVIDGPRVLSQRNGLLELRVVGGPDAGGLLRLGRGEHLVGRAPACAVRVSDPDVSRLHAVLEVDSAGARLRDLRSRNGTTLDGQPVGLDPVPLGPRSVLKIGMSQLQLDVPGADALPGTPDGRGHRLVNRPPRVVPSQPEVAVEFPAPPQPPAAPRLPLLTVAVSLLAVGPVLAFSGGGGAFLIFLLLSPFVLLTQALSDRHRSARQRRCDQAAYEQQVAAARRALTEALADEETRRRAEQPDLATVTAIAEGATSRLWERRREDPDFGRVSVGTGRLPANVRVRADGGDQPPHVEGVPVCVDLPRVGVLGISGPPEARIALGAGLLCQLAVLHSQRDLQIVVVGSGATGGDWHWSSWLPHTMARRGHPVSARVAHTTDQADRQVDALCGLLATRQAAAQVRSVAAHPATEPAVVVLLDGARELRSRPGVARLLAEGPRSGVLAVCLDADRNALPAECAVVVSLDRVGRTLTVEASGAPRIERVAADLMPPERAGRVARALAPLVDATPDHDGGLPTSVRLLDLVGGARLDGLEVAADWCVRGRSTAAVIGATATGPFAVDLARDGPHALIAGITGSGKSELLQTLVASLALANRPDELSMVLVDYKGGAAFDRCADLPHVVGLVTDLDPHLTHRALRSLRAELRRREALLRAAGAVHVDDYAGRRAQDAALAPLPRLILVVDEFAALVEDLPAFVPGLVAVAQRGRSLGVHLVLATQRPGSAVTADIRANTSLRIALRVNGVGESIDVIDLPDAARLDADLPGRALARTAAGTVAFQTAHVSRSVGPAPRVSVRLLPARELGTERALEPVQGSGSSDLALLTAAVRAGSTHLAVGRQQSPWLPPLPDVVPVGDLPEQGGLALPFAVVDEPAAQRQRPWLFDLNSSGHLLIVGGPRSGRTTALRTLAGSAARHLLADVHVHVMDGGAGLAAVDALPHCGAVVPASAPARMARLISVLGAEIRRRQQLLACAGHASLAEYRAAGAARATDGTDGTDGTDSRPGDLPAGPPPFLLLLVDGWETVSGALESVDSGLPVEHLLGLLRDGAAVGLRAVVTGDRSCLTGRLGALFGERLVLRLADPADAALAGLRPTDVPARLPPGRGVRVDGALEVQVAVLGNDGSSAAQTAALHSLAAAADSAGPMPLVVRALPDRVAAERVQQPRAVPARWALLGVGGDDAAAIGVDLWATRYFLVAGPPGSGRSTALQTLATSLGRQGIEVAHLPTGCGPEHLSSLAAAATLGGVIMIDDVAELDDATEQVVLAAALHGCPVVVAGLTSTLAGSYRGPAAEARRCGTGLLLQPSGAMDDQIFGVRAPRGSERLPGRGLLVERGAWRPVQVAVYDEPWADRTEPAGQSVTPAAGGSATITGDRT